MPCSFVRFSDSVLADPERNPKVIKLFHDQKDAQCISDCERNRKPTQTLTVTNNVTPLTDEEKKAAAAGVGQFELVTFKLNAAAWRQTSRLSVRDSVLALRGSSCSCSVIRGVQQWRA